MVSGRYPSQLLVRRWLSSPLKDCFSTGFFHLALKVVLCIKLVFMVRPILLSTGQCIQGSFGSRLLPVVGGFWTVPLLPDKGLLASSALQTGTGETKHFRNKCHEHYGYQAQKGIFTSLLHVPPVYVQHNGWHSSITISHQHSFKMGAGVGILALHIPTLPLLKFFSLPYTVLCKSHRHM